MARGSKEIKPLFDDEQERKEAMEERVEERKTSLDKYKRLPKYKTHVPHNIRIPIEMRKDLEKIAKKLGIPMGKNTGFLQEFTIDALRPAIERAKKELDIE